MKIKSPNILVLIMSLIISVSQSAARANDRATVQGFEKIEDVIVMFQTLAGNITEQNTENIMSLTEDMQGSWQVFVDYHNSVFSGEIIPSEQLIDVITRVSEGVDAVVDHLAAGNYDDALIIIESTLELLEVLKQKLATPVLLDFTGSTCKACKIMKPRLQKVAPAYAERVRIVFVDVNIKKVMTKEYKIMLIPTLVFINNNGEEVARNVGEMEESTIRSKLNEFFRD